MILAAIAGLGVALVLAVLGVRDLAAVADNRRAAVGAALEGVDGESTFHRLDRRLRATGPGRKLEQDLLLAGVEYPPLAVLLAGAGTGVGVAWLLWVLLAPALGVVGILSGVVAVRWYVGHRRTRYTEAFVAQLPEVARVLANAANAGLSIPTAVALTADEVDEPARTELGRVSTRLDYGVSFEEALDELSQRMPSREVAVLLTTLIVSSRSGGSLVSALRDLAEALDQRRETRREVRTLLAESLSTGNIIMVIGFAVLVVLNLVYPGSVEEMTTRPLGQGALLASGLLYAGGVVAIRRMTRIDP